MTKESEIEQLSKKLEEMTKSFKKDFIKQALSSAQLALFDSMQSNFNESFNINSSIQKGESTMTDVLSSQDITINVMEKTFVIRDSENPVSNPYQIDLTSIASKNLVFALVGPAEKEVIDVYYNKKIDERAYYKISSINESNFNTVATTVLNHNKKIFSSDPQQAHKFYGRTGLSVVEHYYNEGTQVHLYSVPMNILFNLETVSQPCAVCYYYSDHNHFVSEEYEYANAAKFSTCSSKEMKKMYGHSNNAPFPCYAVQQGARQVTCSSYKPISKVVLTAKPSNDSKFKVANQYKLSYFEDLEKKKHFVIYTDDNISFELNKFATYENAVEAFNNVISSDYVVTENESFDLQTKVKNKISFLKNIIFDKVEVI